MEYQTKWRELLNIYYRIKLVHIDQPLELHFNFFLNENENELSQKNKDSNQGRHLCKIRKENERHQEAGELTLLIAPPDN